MVSAAGKPAALGEDADALELLVPTVARAELPDCDDGSRVFWLAIVHDGQIERRSAGIGSDRGCSQICPHGQVRRTVDIDESGR